MMDSLEHSLSGILIIVWTTCKESSHFSLRFQIIRVSLYMLLIDSICWKECLNFSHALHLLVYYIITLPPEVVLIEISFIFFFKEKNGLITIYFCFSAVFFLISNIWRDYCIWRSVLCSGFSAFSTQKLSSTRNAQQWELGADDRRMWYHYPTIFCSSSLSICSATFIILEASWELLPKSQKVPLTNPAL